MENLSWLGRLSISLPMLEASHAVTIVKEKEHRSSIFSERKRGSGKSKVMKSMKYSSMVRDLKQYAIQLKLLHRYIVHASYKSYINIPDSFFTLPIAHKRSKAAKGTAFWSCLFPTSFSQSDPIRTTPLPSTFRLGVLSDESSWQRRERCFPHDCSAQRALADRGHWLVLTSSLVFQPTLISTKNQGFRLTSLAYCSDSCVYVPHG